MHSAASQKEDTIPFQTKSMIRAQINRCLQLKHLMLFNLDNNRSQGLVKIQSGMQQ